ncbi:MAG: hypothetical protein WKG00_23010 [Polyangiaceae bacterium]
MISKAVRWFRDKHFDAWMGGYARHVLQRLEARRRAPPIDGPRHLLFSFCDHWEPLWRGVPDEVADQRVQAWSDRYPRLAQTFRDADGHHPRHSFFFPGEQYRPRWLDALAGIARAGLGEVELHLHHDGDTRETLRRDIEDYLGKLASHGHLARDPDGRLRYAFIHGNWCLANARADGRWCGVDDEIPLLFETGCYADFTFPAAPDESQPNIVNQIYWPTGDLGRRRAYEQGERARVGAKRDDRILIVQGPLSLATRRARMPVRIENADIRAGAPGTAHRLRSWVAQDVHVAGRPEWVFVKVHTHGAPERQAAELLGPEAYGLHQALADHYNDGRDWVLHYLTAREMFNVAMAAMDGKTGNPGAYRDHVLVPPPAARP